MFLYIKYIVYQYLSNQTDFETSQTLKWKQIIGTAYVLEST